MCVCVCACVRVLLHFAQDSSPVIHNLSTPFALVQRTLITPRNSTATFTSLTPLQLVHFTAATTTLADNAWPVVRQLNKLRRICSSVLIVCSMETICSGRSIVSRCSIVCVCINDKQVDVSLTDQFEMNDWTVCDKPCYDGISVGTRSRMNDAGNESQIIRCNVQRCDSGQYCSMYSDLFTQCWLE